MLILIFDVRQFMSIALRQVPVCECRQCDDPTFWDEDEKQPRRFICKGCKRWMPWCFGADDLDLFGECLFDYCDDCTKSIIEFQERFKALQGEGAIASANQQSREV